MKSNLKKMMYSIISLIITFGLLYFLSESIATVSSGNYTSNDILVLVVSIFLLLVNMSLFKIKHSPQGDSHFENAQQPKSLDSKKLQKLLNTNLNLNTRYKTPLIIKCQNCKFENMGSKTICINCGKPLNEI